MTVLDSEKQAPQAAMKQQAPTDQASPEQQFVEIIVQRCAQNKGLAARLRRADNPATEYQSWDVLASLAYLGVDLELDYRRLPYVLVAAAIAKSKAERNGTLGLGQALANCYQDGHENKQAQARLRRLLACDDLHEVCRILRPLLSLVNSRGQHLDFAKLLKQLRYFSARSKIEWTQEFYRSQDNMQQGDLA